VPLATSAAAGSWYARAAKAGAGMAMADTPGLPGKPGVFFTQPGPDRHFIFPPTPACAGVVFDDKTRKTSMQSVDATRDTLLACARLPASSETLPLLDTRHRVLARPLVAGLAVPPHDNSAMDGYAVRSAELQRGVALPVSQRLPAGGQALPLQPASVARIFTGAMLPDGADAVVMQEHTRTLPDGRVLFDEAVSAGLNIRRCGEDIAAGSTVLAAGLRLQPAHLGLAASVGVASLPVYAPLRVAVFFTGDELQEPGRPALPGHIYNANRYWLVPALQALGCQVLDLGIVPDRLADTRQLLRDAGQAADVVITSAPKASCSSGGSPSNRASRWLSGG